MSKKILSLLFIFSTVLAFTFAQRTLRYAIDSDGNLIIGEYSIPRDKWVNAHTNTHTSAAHSRK